MVAFIETSSSDLEVDSDFELVVELLDTVSFFTELVEASFLDPFSELSFGPKTRF